MAFPDKHKLKLIIAIAILVRIVPIIFFWNQPLTIVDERHYQSIAENLYINGEFALQPGKPTAIRPPLYPMFLAAIYAVTGGIHVNAVRIVQIVLSAIIVWIVFAIGHRLFSKNVGYIGALIFAAYPSFIVFTHLVLTEVLFATLFLLFLFFFIRVMDFIRATGGVASQTDSRFLRGEREWESTFLESGAMSSIPHGAFRLTALSILAGFFLGLAALTRSILYPFVPVSIIIILVVSWMFKNRRGVWAVVWVGVGAAIVIAPWALRNYTLFHRFVPVGTMGGLNLYMGNYENTPLYRSWAAVDLPAEKAWYRGHEKMLSRMNEAEKQQFAISQAKKFISTHKMLTIKRSIVKAAQFWGLERSIIAAVTHGHWPELNRKLIVVAVALSVMFAYVLVTIGAIFGLVMSVNWSRPAILFCLVLFAYFTVMHAIVFGHSRYHLPLVPLMSIFCGYTALRIRDIWGKMRTYRFAIASALTAVFIGIWTWEIFIVETRKLSGLL